MLLSWIYVQTKFYKILKLFSYFPRLVPISTGYSTLKLLPFMIEVNANLNF